MNPTIFFNQSRLGLIRNCLNSKKKDHFPQKRSKGGTLVAYRPTIICTKGQTEVEETILNTLNFKMFDLSKLQQ